MEGVIYRKTVLNFYGTIGVQKTHYDPMSENY